MAMPTTIMVTGGAGFIGSAFVRHLIAATDVHVVNVDKLTYAGDLRNLEDAADSPRHTFARHDICDAHAMAALFARHRPDAVVHLAAETHVDRSIDAPAEFVRTNVLGTCVLLDAALAHWRGLPPEQAARFRLLHVSTDEVYGSADDGGAFSETSPYRPNSPYSASKASSDHMVRAWNRTYGLPTLTTNCSNNYGPCQQPEKLIPRMIMTALAERQLPVYGRGDNVRDWLHVDDHARALWTVLRNGRPGDSYAIGGKCERPNIEVVETICTLLDELHPRRNGHPYRGLITFVADRPGHDLRYAIDSGKILSELDFFPAIDFATGLRDTVIWYLGQRDRYAAALTDR